MQAKYVKRITSYTIKLLARTPVLHATPVYSVAERYSKQSWPPALA